MKKIIIAFAAVAAAFSLVSCNKEQIETPSTDLKLNIKVADLDGSADTKAAKTGWVAGDKINMWFDDWNHTEQAENHTPDMIIKYNGSAWVIESEAEGLDARLKAEGMLSAVYEGFNDLSKYTYQWWGGSEWFKALRSWFDCETHHRSLIAYIEGTDYAYADNTLSTSLDSWFLQTKFKVLIKNDDSMMNSDAKNYALQVKNTTNDTYASVNSSFTVYPKPYFPEILAGSSNYVGIAGGVQESDGIAFYFSSLTATNADIEFTLLESGADTNISYTVTGKTIDPNVMTNIAINHSKFGVAPEAVDLGLSVKWASFNIGAAKPEDCGWYFAWGETKQKTKYDWSTIGDYKWGVFDRDADLKGMTKYTGNAEGGDGHNILLPEDDAATVNWGSKWRTPTYDEFCELYNVEKCEWTWNAEKNGYNVKGLSTGNSIFLPVAGVYIGTDIAQNMSGYYWGSDIYSDSYLHYGAALLFSSAGYSPAGFSRELGMPVRAVLAE